MKHFTLTFVLFAVMCRTASAEVFTWNNAAGGNWLDSANWDSVSGSYPQQPGDIADFVNLGSVNFTVSIPDVTAVTCGVIRCAVLSNSVSFIGANMNRSFIVLTNDGGTAGILVNAPRASSGMCFLFNTCTIKFMQPTLLMAKQASGIEFDGNLVWMGSTVVTTRNEGTANQYIRMYNNISPNFTGEVVVEYNDLFFRNTIAITNTSLVRAGGTGYILNRETTTRFPVKLAQGGRYHLTGNGVGTHSGAIIAEGDVRVTTDNTLSLPGGVSGTGTVYMTGSGGTARYTGSVSPGASVGMLGFNEDGGTLQLGITGDNLLLNIEVTGNGGVPGIDHDQLVIQNLGTALDLANLDVAFSGVASGQATNWFLVGNAIDLATDFASVEYGAGVSGTIVKEDSFDGSNDRVGAILVPEPAAALLGLAAVLALRRRMRHE
ncbi:hypothetical protein GX586_08715 [bacterium]|nr:hypothetical protein [bacterium]